MSEVCVVGGVCVDIGVSPCGASVPRDSNPSRIGVRIGGVGFNIARRLAELGHSVRMICVLGDDPFRRLIIAEAERTGVRLLPVSGRRSGVYVSVDDGAGDMSIAYSDLDDTERLLTPSALCGKIGIINACDACVLDGNLPSESIEYLADKLTVPVFADPVSTKKALRFLPVLGRLAAIKPNIYEARAMTGLTSPEDCAEGLLSFGCGAVFISCGAEGIYYAQGDERGRARTVPVRGNTTGAGDAACAKLIEGLLAGLPAAEAADNANRFAAEVIETAAE